MKFGLELRASLGQTLTPQQIQYLKLLQMPILQLESQVRQEIELNPMLEDAEDFESDFSSEFNDNSDSYDEYSNYDNNFDDYSKNDSFEKPESYADYDDFGSSDNDANFYEAKEFKTQEKLIDDSLEPFEFHKMLWDGGDEYGKNNNTNPDDDDNEPFQIKDNTSLVSDFIQQLRMLNLSEEEFFLGEQILGNIDEDGYLRRELSEIVEDTNNLIKEINFDAYYKVYQERNNKLADFDISLLEQKEPQNVNALNNFGVGNKYFQEFAHLFQNQQAEQEKLNSGNNSKTKKEIDFSQMELNPAFKYALDAESAQILEKAYSKLTNGTLQTKDSPELSQILSYAEELKNIKQLKEITNTQAEHILSLIQKLEPAGIGSRSVQECLLAQLNAIQKPNEAQTLAKEILTENYDAFAKKHYVTIVKNYGINEDLLRETLDEIKKLNPRPGGGDFQSEMNTVIPDFTIEVEEKTNDLVIIVNDSKLPALKLSKAYQSMKKEAKFKLYNKETRDWIRNKYEDAKFLIQALRQRKNTMLKVMTSIAGIQKDFFTIGPSALKPLIYKDVAEDTGLDISTVCRIVNGKYVQTDFGTFELKYFFSESLPTDEGEEVSTRVIKQILKEIIDAENKSRPYSDDKLSKDLKKRGYNVARRTVAKYREQLKIPVARLRKEI